MVINRSPKPIKCGHCGSEGTIQESLKTEQIKEYYDEYHNDSEWEKFTWKVFVCSHCEKINLLQYVETSVDPITHRQVGYKADGEPVYEVDEIEPQYLYPLPKRFSGLVGRSVQRTYEDAEKCFQKKLFSPCVMCCRKVIDLLCTDVFLIKDHDRLERKLQELEKSGWISGATYDLAKILKIVGNEAIHEYKDYSEKETHDILEFTYFLVDYCTRFVPNLYSLMRSRNISIELLGSHKSEAEEEVAEKINLTEQQINGLTAILASADKEEGQRYFAAVTLAEAEEKLDLVVDKMLEFISKFKSNHKIISEIKNILGNIGNKNPEIEEKLIRFIDDNEDLKICQHIIDILLKLGSSPTSTLRQYARLLQSSRYTKNPDHIYQITEKLRGSGADGIQAFLEEEGETE